MVIFHSYVKVYQRATCINIVLEKVGESSIPQSDEEIDPLSSPCFDGPRSSSRDRDWKLDHTRSLGAGFWMGPAGQRNSLDLRVCSWQWRNSSWNFWSVYSWEFIIYNVNPMYSSAICTVALFDYGNYWRLQASDGTCWYLRWAPVMFVGLGL